MKSKIVLVGIGGYGGQYVMALTNWKGDRDWEVVGIVDPMAEKAQRRTAGRSGRDCVADPVSLRADLRRIGPWHERVVRETDLRRHPAGV